MFPIGVACLQQASASPTDAYPRQRTISTVATNLGGGQDWYATAGKSKARSETLEGGWWGLTMKGSSEALKYAGRPPRRHLRLTISARFLYKLCFCVFIHKSSKLISTSSA